MLRRSSGEWHQPQRRAPSSSSTRGSAALGRNRTKRFAARMAATSGDGFLLMGLLYYFVLLSILKFANGVALTSSRNPAKKLGGLPVATFEELCDPAQLAFDPEALRAKYREERDKRLRADGNEQYREVVGDFSRYVDDPYAERRERAPIVDDI